MAGRQRVRYYLLFTLVFGLFWFLFKFGGFPEVGKALASTALDVMLVLAAVITVVEKLLPSCFYRGRYIVFGFGVLLTVLASGTLNILGQLALRGLALPDYHTEIAKYREHFYYWFWSDLVAGSYFMIAVFVMGGVAIRLAFDRANQARRMAMLESDKLRSELEALKNQINPHFIFNALNTIYYTIDVSNRNARDLTDRFASLLRYQLDECNADGVDIDKEIRFIEDYITLQRERTRESVKISCHGLRSLSGFKIPPLLLMPLVENCFKHVSRHPGQPNFIQINIELKDHIFRFQTRNSFSPDANGRCNGLGLSLTRKRLELLAPRRGQLLTNVTGDCFQTSLTIDLT